MTDIGSLNFCWSQALLVGFVSAGATHAVISPGSRSTPLALAMLRQPELQCEIAIDERGAAFFALGIAKATRRPVLVLATSGTAPANWLPAIIEASQAGVPLILLSADRPPELQACGSNQTIDQISLFGSHVRACHALSTPDADFKPAYLHRLAAQIYEQAVWPLPGPVHINQPFREPLLPASNITAAAPLKKIRISPPLAQPNSRDISEFAAAIAGQPGLIVCGELPKNEDFDRAVVALAAHLDCPILAEPLSGLRFGLPDHSHLCVRYADWLSEKIFVDAHQPAWILRFGAFPVTRQLQRFISQGTATHALVEPWPRWTDPANQLSHVIRAEPAIVCQALLAEAPAPCPVGWRSAFIDRDQQCLANETAWHIPVLIDAADDNTALFIGNSLAIRQLDRYSGLSSKSLHFYANRGASGIDGNIATALGIAEAHGRVIALLGDLSCQHDLGSLALAQGRNAIIVVVNNGGGGIFDLLPQASLPEFERGWRTPQQINFEHAALTFGLNYGQADSAENFCQALHHAVRSGGPHLIELLLP